MLRSKCTFAVVVLAFVVFCGFSKVEAKEVKIGVVDIGFIVQNSEKGKKAKKYIETETQKEQTLIQNKEKELRSLVEDINSKSFLLDEELKRAKAEEANNKKKELERYFQDSRENLQRKQNELMAQILNELVEVIKGYGEKEGFTVIHQSEGTGIIFFDKGSDITQKILELYNSKSK